MSLPDWTGVIFQILWVLTAVYVWELLNSLTFERAFLSRKHAFRWPVVSYPLCRYAFLIALIALLIDMHEIDKGIVPAKMSLLASITFHTALLGSSTNLFISAKILHPSPHPLFLIGTIYLALFFPIVILECIWHQLSLPPDLAAKGYTISVLMDALAFVWMVFLYALASFGIYRRVQLAQKTLPYEFGSVRVALPERYEVSIAGCLLNADVFCFLVASIAAFIPLIVSLLDPELTYTAQLVFVAPASMLCCMMSCKSVRRFRLDGFGGMRSFRMPKTEHGWEEESTQDLRPSSRIEIPQYVGDVCGFSPSTKSVSMIASTDASSIVWSSSSFYPNDEKPRSPKPPSPAPDSISSRSEISFREALKRVIPSTASVSPPVSPSPAFLLPPTTCISCSRPLVKMKGSPYLSSNPYHPQPSGGGGRCEKCVWQASKERECEREIERVIGAL